MKIAVTAQGKTLESSVDPRFGRAPCFVVIETESGDVEVLDNDQNVNAPQGAGIQAAKTIADRMVAVLITGHCGPNAFRALSAAGIKVVVGADGTVSEALEKFKRGEFKPAEDADVAGHWA